MKNKTYGHHQLLHPSFSCITKIGSVNRGLSNFFELALTCSFVCLVCFCSFEIGLNDTLLGIGMETVGSLRIMAKWSERFDKPF